MELSKDPPEFPGKHALSLNNMKNMDLPTAYLTPALLRCSYFNGYATPERAPYEPRTVYEYEIEYYLRSDGGIIVDGRYLSFSAGDLNIRKPGQIVQGVPPYECYILLTDLVGNTTRSGDFTFGLPEEAQERYQNPLLDTLPDKLSPGKKELISGLFENILQNQNASSDLGRFQVRSSLLFLFAELFREADSQHITGKTVSVRQAIRHIREHFLENIPIDRLIAVSGLSHSSFHRHFLEETGMTPGQFITSLRIEQAKNLLSFTHIPIGEIGALCGYEDHVYFSRVFRRSTGMSPTAYRKLTENNAGK